MTAVVGVAYARCFLHVHVGAVCVQSIIFDEVDLTDASVAESSTKNVNNSFTVGPALVLQAARWEESVVGVTPPSRFSVLRGWGG